VKVRAVQFGCGPIGCSIAKYALERSNIELVGAVDVAPDKAGKDLGELAGVGRKIGVPVRADAKRLLVEAKPDIVLHATGSALDEVSPQLELILSAGANVVSTCEELSFPYRRHPRLAERLDRLAREHRVSVLATGVNPGFLMDAWPLFMTGVCKEVTALKVSRIQDASPRRLPFQQKIGAGLTLEEFDAKLAAGGFGHVGLPESISMIAAGLGWSIERIDEKIEPVIATNEVRGPFLTVAAGRVAGIHQVATGMRGRAAAITMEFQAYLGAPESFDMVEVAGTPPLKVKIEGGTRGDIATCSIVVNAVPRVIAAPPGLLTMKDLPIVACAAGL